MKHLKSDAGSAVPLPDDPGAPGDFATTPWRVVLAAGREDSTRAAEALEILCRAYWYPLYAFVRRQENSPHDAQDLTQAFFARLLAKRYLSLADPARGKFRTFLLSSLKHFLANEWQKARRQKRGGGQPVFSLDQDTAETRYQIEPAHELTPEIIYERRWALTLLDRVLEKLRIEYASAGRAELFETLKPALAGAEPSEATSANFLCPAPQGRVYLSRPAAPRLERRPPARRHSHKERRKQRPDCSVSQRQGEASR